MYKYPDQIIDMHTHMFNAKYLPLKGIFRSFGVANNFVTPLARFCWFLTRYSDFDSGKRTIPSHIKNDVSSTYSSAEVICVKSISGYLECLADDCARLIKNTTKNKLFFLPKESAIESSQDTYNSVGWDNMYQVSIELAGARLLSSLIETYEIDTIVTDQKLLRNINDRLEIDLNSFPLADFFRDFLMRAFTGVESSLDVETALDYVDFFWNMTHSEEQIFDRLKAYYNTRDVDFKLVHFMMDMGAPYSQNMSYPKDGYVPFDFYDGEDVSRSQLYQMNDLAKISNGHLIGFSAFDPVRFWKGNFTPNDLVAHMDQALDYNMLGFKFYPPLGFRPSENHNQDLQDIIDVFLDYCTARDLPVFTHCTPEGFQLSKSEKSGLNADPIYWRRALEKNSSRRNLRLCLGHGGGGIYNVSPPGSVDQIYSHGWLANETEWNSTHNYARKVVELCREFPNVYCELANIDVIIKDTCLRSLMKENLAREMNVPKKHGKFRLSDKIIYGTDWHMVGMVNDVVEYYDILVEMVNDPRLIQFSSKFFKKNSLNFLNISISL